MPFLLPPFLGMTTAPTTTYTMTMFDDNDSGSGKNICSVMNVWQNRNIQHYALLRCVCKLQVCKKIWPCVVQLCTDLVRVARVRIHCWQVRHLEFPFYLHWFDVFFHKFIWASSLRLAIGYAMLFAGWVSYVGLFVFVDFWVCFVFSLFVLVVKANISTLLSWQIVAKCFLEASFPT